MNRIQSLASLRAFLGKNSDIINIIELCQLYPMDSWKNWTDHLGNYLKVRKSKRTVSIKHNPEAYAPIITDLYFKSHPKKIAAFSKNAFISFGHDNDNKYNVSFIWFLGTDDRLRLVANYNGGWIKNVAPLSCGVDTLQPVVRNINVDEFISSDILNVQGPIAAKITKSWATPWPPSQEFLNKIKTPEIICDLLNLESEEI